MAFGIGPISVILFELGFNPYTPYHPLGSLILPPISEPIPKLENFKARAVASPPLEPPEDLSILNAFLQCPVM
jgi:hypothetical protein